MCICIICGAKLRILFELTKKILVFFDKKGLREKPQPFFIKNSIYYRFGLIVFHSATGGTIPRLTISSRIAQR